MRRSKRAAKVARNWARTVWRVALVADMGQMVLVLLAVETTREFRGNELFKQDRNELFDSKDKNGVPTRNEFVTSGGSEHARSVRRRGRACRRAVVSIGCTSLP